MPESVKIKVRINGLSAASGSPFEYINVNFVTIEGTQQFGGNFVLSRTELKKLGVTIGDLITITLSTTE